MNDRVRLSEDMSSSILQQRGFEPVQDRAQGEIRYTRGGVTSSHSVSIDPLKSRQIDIAACPTAVRQETGNNDYPPCTLMLRPIVYFALNILSAITLQRTMLHQLK